ncbi:MAG: hypothetical protein PHI00_07555, partial [Atribacterota bacterium]|nr:hypothetical protein [Atribacterota bacterium]
PSIGKDRACPLPLYRFLIETLRNPSPPSFPKSSIGNPKAFKYLWTPDRTIQGQAKNGSKVTGVTRRWASMFLLFLFGTIGVSPPII